jgi:hypothetical protein
MTSDARDIRTWDGVVLFWVVLWLIIGCAVGITIWGLSGLSESAVQSGRALDNAGQALEGLGKIPVIGEGPSDFGAEVRATATGIITNGEQAGDRIQALAVLLGVTIAIVPSVPVGGFYVPFRLRRRRDIQQVREVLRSDGLNENLRDYLANRAVVSLTFPQVSLAIGPNGSPTSVEGRTQLALAELRRLGIRPNSREHQVDG